MCVFAFLGQESRVVFPLSVFALVFLPAALLVLVRVGVFRSLSRQGRWIDALLDTCDLRFADIASSANLQVVLPDGPYEPRISAVSPPLRTRRSFSRDAVQICVRHVDRPEQAAASVNPGGTQSPGLLDKAMRRAVASLDEH